MTRLLHLLLQISLIALIFPVSDDVFRRVFLLCIAVCGQMTLLFGERILAEDQPRNLGLVRLCHRAFVVYLLVLLAGGFATAYDILPFTFFTSWFYGAYGLVVFATLVSVLLFVRELRAKKKPAKTPAL